MKRREFDALIRKHLLTHLPQFGVNGGVLFVRPLVYILRGYCFESSGFDPKSFYVWAFAQPLFVPTEALTLDLGCRLGAIRGRQCQSWKLTGDNEAKVMADVLRHINREGSVVVENFRTLEDFVRNAIGPDTNPYSPYPPEMVAYGAVLLDDVGLVKKMFDRLEKSLADAKDHRPYHDEILERARSVRRAFERDPAQAVDILNTWRDQTAKNLKLAQFIEP